MVESRRLPGRAVGGPIPGEPTVTEWLPMGLQRGLPSPLGAAVAAAFARRDRLGHLRDCLAHGVSDTDALGILGTHHAALPGTLLDAPRLARLQEHTAPLLHPSHATDLRSLAARSPTELGRLGRLGHVLRHTGGERGYTVVEPNDAAPAFAAALATARPHRQGWVVSADLVGTGAAWAIAKAARLLGVRHLDSDGRLRDGATAVALESAWGQAATGARLADLPRADLILLWGVQAADAPGLLDLLAAARDGGARVVAIDAVLDEGFRPSWLPSRPVGTLFGTRLVDDTVPVGRGHERALIGALLGRLRQWGVVDAAPVPAAETHGVPPQRLDWLAQLLARAGTVMSVWGPGLMSERDGADAGRAVLALHDALGAHGRPGTGVIGLRARANAQGHDDVGLSATRLPGALPHTVARAKALADRWGHPVRQQPGASVLEQLALARDGELDLLVVIGDPFADLPAGPVRDALGRVPHRIHLVSRLDTTCAVPAPDGGAVWLLPVFNPCDGPEPTVFTSLDGWALRAPGWSGRPHGGEREPAWRRVVRAVAEAQPEVADALAWPTLDAVLREAAEALGQEGLDALGPERPARAVHGPRQAFREALHEVPLPAPVPTDGYRLVFRDGHALPGGARWADRANGLDRDTIGLSSADAHREGLADGDPCVLLTAEGRLAGRARIVDIVPGHAWVAWPEASRLVALQAQSDGGALDRTTVATLQVP